MPWEKFKDFMNQLPKTGTLLVAFSGGLDSTALLHLTRRWRDRFAPTVRILAAHLHHGLRGRDADSDLEFCRDFAARMGVDFLQRHTDVKKLARERRMGLEEAGRLARYSWFAELSSSTPTIVLTGHHADDQVETVLLHLRRGAHRRGLCGMKALSTLPIPKNGDVTIARPLLDTPKDNIKDFALKNGLTWCEDATNLSISFERNRIRNKIIPMLDAVLPGYRDRLLAMSRTLAKEESELVKAGNHVAMEYSTKERGGRLFRLEGGLLDEPERLAYAFRHILESDSGIRLPHASVLNRLARLAESGKVGESLSLPGMLAVRREHDGLFFYFPDKSAQEPEETLLPEPPFSLSTKGLTINASLHPWNGTLDDVLDPDIEWFDAGSILWPLRIRPVQPGDRMRPLGSSGSKKIQDIFIDAKIPQRRRSEARVIADHAGIVWLWPHRLGNRARLTPSTALALRLEIREDKTGE